MKLFSGRPSPTAINEQEQFLRMLYEKYARYLQHLALSFLHDEQSAEDIVGEVFLHLVKNISCLQQYSCSQLNNYIVICTKGRCLNLLKQRKSALEHEQSLDDEQGELLELASTDSAVDAHVIRKIDLEVAAQLLEQVTPAYRDTFKLKYQLGLDDTAIAQAFGI